MATKQQEKYQEHKKSIIDLQNELTKQLTKADRNFELSPIWSNFINGVSDERI